MFYYSASSIKRLASILLIGKMGVVSGINLRENLRSRMKNYLRSIFGLCILLLLFFSVNAMGIRSDPSTALIIGKADLNSQNPQLLKTLANPEPIASEAVSESESVPTSNPAAGSDKRKGPGSSAMVILAFALVILVSGRQRRV
jgi:hypothetical protein